MDRTEIDMQVLSAPPCAFFDWTDPPVAIKMARTLNGALCSAVQDEPERFVGLPSVTLQDHAAAVEELECAVAQLGWKCFPT